MNNLKVLEFDQVIFILYNTILSDVDDDGLCVMLKDLFSQEHYRCEAVWKTIF